MNDQMSLNQMVALGKIPISIKMLLERYHKETVQREGCSCKREKK